MVEGGVQFPYFLQVPQRSLSTAEASTVARLLEALPKHYADQLMQLRVVGRCGCGKCPTVFFQPHQDGDRETDISCMSGRDESGGLVGVALMEKDGVLSQLDFYSIDGHEPWTHPDPDSLSAS